MTEHSIVEIIEALRRSVSAMPDATALRAIRETIDDPAFGREVAEFLRVANSDDSRHRLRRELNGLQRDLEELAAQREGRLRRLGLMGIGGGTALATGAIVAALTLRLRRSRSFL